MREEGWKGTCQFWTWDGSQNSTPHPPTMMPASSSWDPANVNLQGKRESRLQKGLRLFISWPHDRERSLDYPGGSNGITRGFKSGRRKHKRKGRGNRDYRRVITWCDVAGFKDGGRGHQSEHGQPVEAAKDKEGDSSQEPPAGNTALLIPRLQPGETHVGLLCYEL